MTAQAADSGSLDGMSHASVTALTDRVRGVDPRTADVLIALALAAALQMQLAFADRAGEFVVDVVGGLLLTLPLAWRRQQPLVVALAFIATAVSQQLAGGDLFAGEPPLLASLVAGALTFYSLGAHAEDRAAVTGAGVGVVGLWASVILSGEVDAVSFIFSAGLVVAAPWLAGRGNRARTLRLASLQREQQQRERLAVSDERARIARELHDVVAHSVGVMVMQAHGALRKLDRDPERAREALHAIEDTGRNALDDMRRSLGVLRREGGQAALAPQPGLGDLSTLLDSARQAGLQVEVSVEGEPKPLPVGIELSAYRIVQEALTNTIKHADATRTSVTLRFGQRDLELEMCDDGAEDSADGAAGSPGHGIVGMRERVALYGGELHAGHRAEGGFAVHARIPLAT